MNIFIRPLCVFMLACGSVFSLEDAAPKTPAKCTFSWSMETEAPDIFQPGSDDKPSYYPPAETFRTEKQAHGGKFALDLSGRAWRQATFDNPTNNHVWATPQQGAIVLWWKYTGAFSSGMLMQLTGKSKDKKLDANDGVSIRFHGDKELRFGYGWENSKKTTHLLYKHGAAFTPDKWYKVTAKWNTATAPHLSLQVDDGKPVVGGEKPGATQTTAWHQILCGNDTRAVPEGLFIDDFQIWDGWDIPETK